MDPAGSKGKVSQDFCLETFFITRFWGNTVRHFKDLENSMTDLSISVPKPANNTKYHKNFSLFWLDNFLGTN
jgi:hypothetical protein